MSTSPNDAAMLSERPVAPLGTPKTYQTLDSLITDAISHKAVHFTALFCSKAVQAECQRLGKLMAREPFRVMDLRLQALKRNGTLRYSTKEGWMIASRTEPIPQQARALP